MCASSSNSIPSPCCRLHFDGNSLSIEANVSDITGLGLGVHTTINPKDAKSFAVSDGKVTASCNAGFG